MRGPREGPAFLLGDRWMAHELLREDSSAHGLGFPRSPREPLASPSRALATPGTARLPDLVGVTGSQGLRRLLLSALDQGAAATRVRGGQAGAPSQLGAALCGSRGKNH